MSLRSFTAPGLLMLAVLIATLLLTQTGDDPYIVRAELDNAGGLRTNSLVDVAGHPVGRVRDMSLTRDDKVLTTLEIEHDAGPIGAGAQAEVRPANLLGEKYVDLNVGRAASAPLPSNALIPASRTGSPVELDDVVDILDAPTRTALSALINESGIALTGRGAEFGQTVMALPSSLDRTGALLDELGRDNRALGRLVTTSDRVLASIARRRADLGRLVGSANGALSVTAANHEHLGATVRSAPGALAQLQGTLARLQGTAIPLGEAADELRGSSPALRSLLTAVEPFSKAARPTLRTAGQAAPDLTRLGRRAAPVVRRLRPVARDLDRFARVVDPTTDALLAGLPDTLGAAEGWARAIQGRDGSGHLFRNDPGLTGDTLKVLVNSLARRMSPIRPRKKRRARQPSPPRRPEPAASMPSPTNKPPLDLKLPALPPLGKVLEQLPKLPELPRVLPPRNAAGDQSDRTLLDFLLKP